jgi:ankyrin repeat protein
MLFQAGYDVNYKGDYGYTPLHKAVYNICDIVIFEALLAAGADITVTDYEGFTALDLLEQMLDEKSSKLFSSYRLRSEIDQLEKIKAILLQAQN